tara:strand:- start:553 stop:1455 length:903 start_codon:yes stop_codon:yes gene_type:complete
MVKKNILVTGSTGLLGSTLVASLEKDYNVFGTARRNFKGNLQKNFLPFDLAKPSYQRLFEWAQPQVVIHCAAITDIDYCEQHPQKAIQINYEPIKKLGQNKSIEKIIFISSDAVFDGLKRNPSEKSFKSPLNMYGKTKQKSEEYLLCHDQRNIVIRTTIIGKNTNPKAKDSLVEWIFNSLKNRKIISLFNDVVFNPITTLHLAHEIGFLINTKFCGVFHISGSETISKYSFGKKLSLELKLDSNLIRKGSIKNSHFIATRSNNQTLNTSFYTKMTGRKLPDIDDTINQLVSQFPDKETDL